MKIYACCIIAILAFMLPAASSKDVLLLPLHTQTQFQCMTPDKTYDHKWNVNGTMVTSNSQFPDIVYITSQTFSNGSTQGSLTFTAHAQANNTNIRCFILNDVQSIIELEHYIVLQGYPSSPDVAYVMEPHSIRFSWSTPLTDSALYYTIDVITADHNTTINTTHRVFLLQPGFCQFADYRVEIAAVNIVGMGGKYTSPPLRLEELTLSGANVIFGKNSTEINIQISTTCLKDIHYNVELIPSFSTKRIVISNSSSVGQTSLTLSSPDIRLNDQYEAIVRVNGSTFSHHIELSTFDVQTVEITPQNDVKELTDITCHFGLGSLVKGCRIVISINDVEVEEKMNGCCEYTATREEGSTEGTISVMLPRGEYTVVVYDDEDAEVKNPAYNSTITITNSSLMQPSESASLPTKIDSLKAIVAGTVAIGVLLLVVASTCIVILILTLLYCYKHRSRGKETRHTSKPNEYTDIESLQRASKRSVEQFLESSDPKDSDDSKQPTCREQHTCA